MLLSMLLGGEHLAKTWAVGGRVSWLALGASFIVLKRVAEKSAEACTRAPELYCLR